MLILRRTFAALLLGLAALPAAGADDRPVLVFAAASLKNALDEATAAYAAAAGIEVVASYAASSALARQIEAGAPADLFVSADVPWMDYLEERELISNASRRDLLGNDLVLVAPRGAESDLRIAPGFPLAEALGQGRLAMADPDAVPAGKYGKASLEALGVWGEVEARIARAENVRAALAFVARGEAPFGIVYRTDAAAEPEVEVVGMFPADSHPPIIYPAALLAQSTHPQAMAFMDWLGSPAAALIFTRQGFRVAAQGS
jgi:molybdate transport system substrate-binding protein